MSFSTEIKEEIIKKGVGGKCCKKAFLGTNSLRVSSHR
jgi:DNA-binding transcriptional regulator WhiA